MLAPELSLFHPSVAIYDESGKAAQDSPQGTFLCEIQALLSRCSGPCQGRSQPLRVPSSQPPTSRPLLSQGPRSGLPSPAPLPRSAFYVAFVSGFPFSVEERCLSWHRTARPLPILRLCALDSFPACQGSQHQPRSAPMPADHSTPPSVVSPSRTACGHSFLTTSQRWTWAANEL